MQITRHKNVKILFQNKLKKNPNMKNLKNIFINLIKVNDLLKNNIYLSLLLLLPFSVSAQTQLSTLVSTTNKDWGIVKGQLPNSFFAGAWTKIAAPIGSGVKGNDYPVSFMGTDGSIVGVSGNLNFGGGNPWMYNANTMTFDIKDGYLADHAFYLKSKTEQECRGWVYIAFYIQRVGSTTNMTTYAKIGTTGAIEQSETTTEKRTFNLNEVNIGGYNSNTTQMHLQHLKIYDMPSTPTSAQIDAIALNTKSDPTAWAYWPLIAGGTNDISGNGRTISLLGKWTTGVNGPNLNSSSISLESISLNIDKISLNINQTSQLKATILPQNATNQAVTWTSSNNNIATVSSTGLITAKAKGNAIITVTTKDGGKTALVNATITPIPTATSLSTELEATVILYPNPAQSVVNIQLPISNLYKRIILSDITGKEIMTQEITGDIEQVDVSGINKGLYILTLKGEATYRKTIVVE